MANNYYNQAQSQYDVSYNQKVQNMKNQLAQNQLALEQSKGGVNQNFDHQVGQQNLSNKLGKNNMSNSMLGRGLGNSSIAVTGLAEADQINNRKVGDINMNRTNALNDIEAQKTQLAQNTNNTLAQMGADREDAIWALARQLEDRQWDKDFKNKQYNLQAQSQANEQAYRNAMMSFEKQKYADAQARAKEQSQYKINQYSDNAMYELENMLKDTELSANDQLRYVESQMGKYDGVEGFEAYNRQLKSIYDRLNKSAPQYGYSQARR